MSLIKLGKENNAPYTVQQNTKYEDFSKEPHKLNDPSALKEKAEKSAEKSDGKFDSDDMKYQMAVELAQDRLSDVQDVDNNILKKEIDNIYENELGASTTGREHRGENGFSDVVNNLNDLFTNVNNGIGNVMDFAFDNTIGNIAGLWGGKDSVQNMFSGEDLAIIPDIIEDVALASLGPAGIAAAVGKNLIQQSDNIAEAALGKDTITQRSIDAPERIAKGALGLGTAALSGIPGVGKARRVAEVAKGSPETKALARLEDVARGPQWTAKRVKNNIIDYGKQVKEGFKNARDIINPNFGKDRKALIKERDIAKDMLQDAKADAKKDFGRKRYKNSEDWQDARDLFSDAQANLRRIKSHPIQAGRQIADSLVPRGKYDQAVKDYSQLEAYVDAYEKGKDAIPGTIRSLAESAATMLPMGIASFGAEDGLMPTSIDPASIALAFFPVGAKKYASSKLSPSGKLNGHWSFPAVQGAAFGNQLTNAAEHNIWESYDEDEVNNRLLNYLSLNTEGTN